MIFKSLKKRISVFITGIVVASLLILIGILAQQIYSELSDAYEENAQNLMAATLNLVESQYNSIQFHRASTISHRQKALKANITIAMGIISAAYESFQNGLIDEDTAQKQAIGRLRNLKYDEGVGYFWINDIGRPYPRMIMHATLPSLDGTILDNPEFDCALGKGENLFKAFVDVCMEKGEGYVDYLWPKPTPQGLTAQQPKLSFVKLFKPWGWIIGTGVYIDDIETDVQQRISAVIKDLNTFMLRGRIGESGYFFLFDSNKRMLVHPSLAGQDVSNLKNPETGNSLMEEFMLASNNPDHFYEYLWDKPGFEGQYRFPKRASIAFFEPLGWYVGSSIYLDDFEKRISEVMSNLFLVSIIFILAVLFVSASISRSIATPLSSLVKSIEKTDETGLPIGSIPSSKITEIETLSSTLRNMINSVMESRDSLQNSERKYRSLVETTSDFIWEIDSNGYYTYASPQVRKILGYEVSEIEGNLIYELMPQDEAVRIRRLVENLTEQHNLLVNIETTITHKSGSIIILEKSVVPVFSEDGIRIGYRGIDRDITERKRNEEKLNKLRIYLDNIIDSMPSMVIGVNSNCTITQWNKMAEKRTGISSKDACGRNLLDAIPWMASEIDRIMKSIQRQVITTDPRKNRQTAEGTRYDSITIYPLKGKGIEGAVLRVDDITDRTKLEDMMIQSEKMLSVGGLAAGMAHEINNPLAGIIQNVQLIQNRMNPELKKNREVADECNISLESMENYLVKRGMFSTLNAVADSGQRAAKIVENMLSFSRKSTGMCKLENLATLIDKTIDLAKNDYDLKQSYDFKRLEIIREYSEDMPAVSCEASKIQQVILNLLKNSAQAMAETQTPVPTITVSLRNDNAMAFIEIEDNGPGMPEEVRMRVFEPFFSTKVNAGGTGLGLSVSYFIITEDHRGTMHVESTLGIGTRFIIGLPISSVDSFDV